MRAVFYETHGDAQVLQVGELDKPACEPEQVLVEVAAAGVNPIDRRLRAGELTEYIQRTFRVVPVFDHSVRIAEVGTAVTDWQVGDEIMGLAFTWSIKHGTYAELAPVDAAASAANADYVKALGADVVIDYQNEPEGVDMVLEALLGDGTDEAAIRITKTEGAVAYMNNEPPDMPDIADRNIRAEFIHHRADGAMLAELGALYEQGVLPLPQTETLPLESAVEAHLHSESRRTRGKLELSINDL